MASSSELNYPQFNDWIDSNNLEEVIDQTDQLLNSEVSDTLDRVELLIYKSRALNFLGEPDRARIIMQEVWSLLESFKTEPMETSSSDIRLLALRQMAHGNMISILRKTSFESAMTNEIKDHIDTFYSLLERFANLNPRLLKEKSWVLRNQGIMQWNIGKLDQALHYYYQALDIDEALDDRQSTASTLNNIGVIYYNKGDLDQSLDYYNRSLHLRKELGNAKGIADALNNIGLIHRQRGEMDRSLDYYRESLRIYDELGLDHFYAHTLSNIANIRRMQGNLVLAQQYYEQCLDLYRKSSSTRFVVRVLGDLVELMLQVDNVDEAEVHLQVLKNLSLKYPEDRVVKLHYDIAQGLIYKHKKTLSSIVDAENIFRSIIEQDIIDYSKTLVATYSLVELLIFEYQTSEDAEVLTEIQDLLISIQQISKEQQLFPTLIQTFVLRAKLGMIQGDYKRCKVLLQQAEMNAEEFGLPIYRKQVKSELDKMNRELIKYKEILENNSDIVERLKTSDIVDYLTQVQQSVV